MENLSVESLSVKPVEAENDAPHKREETIDVAMLAAAQPVNNPTQPTASA